MSEKRNHEDFDIQLDEVDETQVFHDYFFSIAKKSHISIDSFIENYRELGFPYSPMLIQHVLRLIGLNSSNRIEFERYISFISLAKEKHSDARLKVLFDLFSQNNSTISKKSFENIGKSIWKSFNSIIGYHNFEKPMYFGQTFNDINLKQDGNIEFEEFKQAYCSKNYILLWAEFFIFGGLLEYLDPITRFSALNTTTFEKNIKFFLETLERLNKPNNHRRLFEMLPNEYIENFLLNFPFKDHFSRIEITPLQIPYPSITNTSNLMLNEEDLTETLLKILKILQISKLNYYQESKLPYFPSLNIAESKVSFKLEYNFELLVSLFSLLHSYYKNSESIHENTEKRILIPQSPYSHKSACKLVIYRPLSFSSLIESFFVTPSDILNSFSLSGLISKLLHFELSLDLWTSSLGRSGSFFYVTDDKKFMIKSIGSGEFEFLLNFLPNYENYIKNNKNSLISKIFGLYRMKKYEGNASVSFYFIIMNYVFNYNEQLTTIIDVKGSISSRKAEGFINNIPYLKDWDFERSNIKILLNEDEKEKIYEQIENDSKFLEKNSLMDYSLLIGCSNFSDKNKIELESNSHIFFSLDQSTFYYFGIIDILTVYSLKKKFENFFKSSLVSNDISCIPPSEYSQRFLKYIQKIFH